MQRTEITEQYQAAIDAIKKAQLIPRDDKKIRENYMVPTHGPALVRALIENPELLDLMGIYRVNCSHLGKEPNLEIHAEFLRTIHPFVPILIDLQGPKPRIHELVPGSPHFPVRVGDRFEVSYAPSISEYRFCTPGQLRVCFPEITRVMQTGDAVIFDDGKMTAVVREKGQEMNTIECVSITSGEEVYMLGGRKGICARNRPLGIPCITDHDRKSIEFSRDILGFEYVDNMMVSYFSTLDDITHFIEILREEYHYTGELGAKFETPLAVANVDAVLSLGQISLTMFGRGDLRIEMDPRAIPNMHDIQTHFFSICRKHAVESICATGFVESMIPLDGQITPEEIYDMETSMRTYADHLMLSGESSYGTQAKNCIETEARYQREMFTKLQAHAIEYCPIPEASLCELLYLDR